MKISAIQTGFALYKEADVIGRCGVTPTPKGATSRPCPSCPSGGGKATAPIC